jgi:hypothetical protein
VTTPHKQPIMPLVDRVTAGAAHRRVDRRGREGRHATGFNNDGNGFVQSLRMPTPWDPYRPIACGAAVPRVVVRHWPRRAREIRVNRTFSTRGNRRRARIAGAVRGATRDALDGVACRERDERRWQETP